MNTEYHTKWKYKDHERPQGCCYDCGMKYTEFPDMMVPDDLWEKINPTYCRGAGLLCPTCIAKRLYFANEWYKFVDKYLKGAKTI